MYVFANVFMYPEKPGITGKLKKFNVLTGETVWEVPDQYPNWGGAMTTDGGLVFYGEGRARACTIHDNTAAHSLRQFKYCQQNTC